jgi:riboflavin transporter FmnP
MQKSIRRSIKKYFLLSGVALVLGIFSFALPKTPLVKLDENEKPSFASIIGLDAIKLLKDKTS